jgi:hypothetical protein
LKAIHHILVSSAKTRRAFNYGFDTGNLRRPSFTPTGNLRRPTLPGKHERREARTGTLQSGGQGLTLVHFSAQRKRFLWDRGCI